jgi:hypothetical protein
MIGRPPGSATSVGTSSASKPLQQAWNDLGVPCKIIIRTTVETKEAGSDQGTTANPEHRFQLPDRSIIKPGEWTKEFSRQAKQSIAPMQRKKIQDSCDVLETL